MNDLSQKTLYCAAIADAVVHLTAMTRDGLCHALPFDGEKTDALHFVVSKTGASILVTPAIDVDSIPVFVTSDDPSLRWFSAVKWDCALLGKDKIKLQGDSIAIGDGVTIPSFILEIPVSRNVFHVISRSKWLSIGYATKDSCVVAITGGCKIINYN